jgi:predicted RNase H-like HicB family nuclease
MNKRITIVLTEDPQAGGYTVTSPDFPGLVTEGDSVSEALVMAADAIKALEAIEEESR